MPSFFIVADAINEIIKETTSLCHTSHFLPISLKIVDIDLFSELCLNAPWPESRKSCRDLIASLENMIDHKIFRVYFQKKG